MQHCVLWLCVWPGSHCLASLGFLYLSLGYGGSPCFSPGLRLEGQVFISRPLQRRRAGRGAVRGVLGHKQAEGGEEGKTRLQMDRPGVQVQALWAKLPCEQEGEEKASENGINPSPWMGVGFAPRTS